jgi:sec-independent protein translocase protein TatA
VGISFWQILIVVGLILLIFGPSRLPGLGKSIGEAIRGFKKGISEDEIDVTNSQEKIQDKEDENNKA